jgi:putative endonuclease
MESGRKFLTRAGKGREGEEKAADYLQGKGYGILARNFHSRTGELDIVAVKDGTVAFIEVKSWRVFGRSDLEYSIGGNKRRRIRTAARLFLAKHPWLEGMRIRFDVILLRCESPGEGVLHIENAFSGAVSEWSG